MRRAVVRPRCPADCGADATLRQLQCGEKAPLGSSTAAGGTLQHNKGTEGTERTKETRAFCRTRRTLERRRPRRYFRPGFSPKRTEKHRRGRRRSDFCKPHKREQRHGGNGEQTEHQMRHHFGRPAKTWTPTECLSPTPTHTTAATASRHADTSSRRVFA
jgi:hypothetical protein